MRISKLLTLAGLLMSGAGVVSNSRLFFADGDDSGGGGGGDDAGGDDEPLLSSDAAPPPPEPPAPPTPVGTGYDWEADPLGLANVPFKAEDKEFLIAGKYKGATVKEVLQQAEKGYLEAQKLASQKGLVPPETYDVTSKAFEACDEASKAEFQNIGKSLGLTQKQLEALVEPLAEIRDTIATQKNEEKLADSWGVKVGSAEYKERVGKLERWVGEAIRNGAFTHDQIFAKGTGLSTSPGGVRFLEAEMNRFSEKGVWTGDGAKPVGLTLDEARAYVVDAKSAYHNPSDPNYTKIREAVDKAYLSQPGGSERVL